MKKIKLFILGSILATISFAQQFPLQSQYQFNYPTINPSAVGENDFYRARASFREQWVGLTDSPISTQILTVTKGYGVNGLGITIFNDRTGGAFNKSGGALSYSHKVKLSTSELYFGISAGFSKINLEPSNDPAFNISNDMIPEVTFGAYYKVGNLNIGISVPGLLNANMEFTSASDNTIDRNLYTMISYSRELNEVLTIHPSILVKTTKNHNQIDANINFNLKNKLWFGTSYRQNFGPTIYVGIDFARLLSVYSLDFSTNEASNYSSGSHEFTVGYDFILQNEVDVVDEEEVINDELNDIDKDGVSDKDDLCPNVFGDELAGGCPDFDNDGTPDKFDLCPHLFGASYTQGCPELESNEKVIISSALLDLNFDSGKDIINNYSYSSLTDLVVLMHKNPSMMLFLGGHSSEEGSSAYNLNLSARRVKSVQKFFIERGVSKKRLLIDFHGEDEPLYSNENEVGRAKNRRVDFEVKYHLHDDVEAKNLKNEYDSLINIIQGGIINNFDSTIIEDSGIDSEIFEDTIINADQIKSSEIINEIIIENKILEEAINNEVVKDLISIKVEENNYLVIVQVFSDERNAIEYIKDSKGELIYISRDGRFYVYVFASVDREASENFRSVYEESCWILNLN